jgi:hypothetical protein
MGDYVVVIRCASSVVFEENQRLTITMPRAGDTPVSLTFTSRYVDRGFEVRVPDLLQIVATGSSADIEQATTGFTNLAGEILPIISVVSNAWIGHRQVELAYDNAPDKDEHEYFQVQLREELLEVVSGRNIPIIECRKVIHTIGASPDRDRIMRAMAQYAVALQHWQYGDETQALSHLYMGMEALKSVVLDQHLASRSMTDEELAHEWGFREGKGYMNRPEFLLAETRKRLLFDGNERCHQIAKKISDTFEHGYEDYGSLRPVATQVVVQTARYLRTAILSASGLDEQTRNALLVGPYADPLGQLNAVKYLRGRLLGKPPLAATGQAHPFCEWTTTLDRVIRKDGRHSFQLSEKIVARINDNVKLQHQSLEVWDGSKLTEQPLPEVPKKA